MVTTNYCNYIYIYINNKHTFFKHKFSAILFRIFLHVKNKICLDYLTSILKYLYLICLYLCDSIALHLSLFFPNNVKIVMYS